MPLPPVPAVTRPRRGVRTRSLGISLIELMVSLTLGLLLMVSVVNAYVGSSRAAQVTEAQARMHDDANAALAVLKANIRMAGNNPERPMRAADAARNPVYTAPALTAFAIRGCDSGFANGRDAGRIDDLVCATNPGAGALSVTYEADAFNTAGVDGAAVPLDCAGVPLAARTAAVTTYDPLTNAPNTENVQYYFNESRFYVETGNDGVPRLLCRGGGTGFTPGVLAENVEDFRLTYGVVSPSATSGLVAGYVTAAGIASRPEFAPYPEPERWGKVAAVGICLLLRTAHPVVHDAASAKYVDCSGALVDAPDLRLRHAFRATVVIRGRT